MRILLICIGLLLLSVQVKAAPSVTGTSGTFTSGQSVTISGSSFGTKTTAAPIKWTSFEEGVNGDRLYAHDNDWCAFGGGGESTCGAGSGNKQGMYYANTSPATGSLFATNHLTSVEGFSTNFYILDTPAPEQISTLDKVLSI